MRRYGACIVLFLLSGCSYRRITVEKEYESLQERIEYRAAAQTHWDSAVCPSIEKMQEIDALINAGLARNDAIRIALLNNRDLQAALENLGVAKSNLAQASLFTNPEILSINGYTVPHNQEKPDVLFRWLQSLSDFWKIPFAKRVAKDELEIQILSTLDLMFSIIRDTRMAYDRALFASMQLKNVQEIYKEVEKLPSLHEANFAKKDEYRVLQDKDFIVLTQTEWRIRIIEYLAEYRIADVNLKRVLGLINPADEFLKLTSTLEDAFIELPTVKNLQTCALQFRPSILAAVVNIKRFDDKITLEYSRIFDDVRIGVTVARNLFDFKQFGPSAELHLPVFDQNQAQIAKAHFERQKAQKELIALEVNTNAEVYGYKINLEAIIKKIKIFNEQILKAANEIIKITIDHREKPLASEQISLLNSRVSLYAVRTEFIDLHLQALNMLSNLERLLGKRLDLEPIYLHPTDSFVKKLEAIELEPSILKD